MSQSNWIWCRQCGQHRWIKCVFHSYTPNRQFPRRRSYEQEKESHWLLEAIVDLVTAVSLAFVLVVALVALS